MLKIFKLFLVISCLVFPAHPQAAGEAGTVKINALIIDESNNPVRDLKQEEIVVLEKGKPQTISSFANVNRPLIYALTVDNSGSFKSILGFVKKALKLIIDENTTDDESILIRFIDSEKIEVVQEFTSEKKLLTEEIDNLYIEGGQTALIDAIYLSIEKVSRHNPQANSRRAIIAVTDGEERDSYYSEKQLKQLIEKENVQIFFIGIVELLSKERVPGESSVRQIAKNRTEEIAQKSGGAAFFPKSPQEFDLVSSKIKQLIKSQYMIEYSASAGRKEACHKPKVEFAKRSRRKDVKIIVRDGCFGAGGK